MSKYRNKMHEYVRKITPLECKYLAAECDVKWHYIKRLAHGTAQNPRIQTINTIVAKFNEYSDKYPMRNLPQLSVDDFIDN